MRVASSFTGWGTQGGSIIDLRFDGPSNPFSDLEKTQRTDRGQPKQLINNFFLEGNF